MSLIKTRPHLYVGEGKYVDPLFVKLQIDIGGELHQKTLRAAQRYLAGKDVFSNIFDEAQLSVFKELLPYWAGFRKSYSPPEDPNKKPSMGKNWLSIVVLLYVYYTPTLYD